MPSYKASVRPGSTEVTKLENRGLYISAACPGRYCRIKKSLRPIYSRHVSSRIEHLKQPAHSMAGSHNLHDGLRSGGGGRRNACQEPIVYPCHGADLLLQVANSRQWIEIRCCASIGITTSCAALLLALQNNTLQILSIQDSVRFPLTVMARWCWRWGRRRHQRLFADARHRALTIGRANITTSPGCQGVLSARCSLTNFLLINGCIVLPEGACSQMSVGPEHTSSTARELLILVWTEK